MPSVRKACGATMWTEALNPASLEPAAAMSVVKVAHSMGRQLTQLPLSMPGISRSRRVASSTKPSADRPEYTAFGNWISALTTLPGRKPRSAVTSAPRLRTRSKAGTVRARATAISAATSTPPGRVRRIRRSPPLLTPAPLRQSEALSPRVARRAGASPKMVATATERPRATRKASPSNRSALGSNATPNGEVTTLGSAKEGA